MIVSLIYSFFNLVVVQILCTNIRIVISSRKFKCDLLSVTHLIIYFFNYRLCWGAAGRPAMSLALHHPPKKKRKKKKEKNKKTKKHNLNPHLGRPQNTKLNIESLNLLVTLADMGWPTRVHLLRLYDLVIHRHQNQILVQQQRWYRYTNLTKVANEIQLNSTALWEKIMTTWL